METSHSTAQAALCHTEEVAGSSLQFRLAGLSVITLQRRRKATPRRREQVLHL